MCSKLTSVTLPEKLTSIEASTFSGCERLASINLPDGLTSIGRDAILGCILTSIDLPESLTSIGKTNLSTLLGIASEEPDTSDKIFGKVDPIPVVSVVPGSYADEWAQKLGLDIVYTEVTLLPCGPLTYRVRTNSSIIIVACSADAVTVEIPDTIDGMPVTAIAASAFRACAALTDVTIPASVTSIPAGALESCAALRMITVEPDSHARQWCRDNHLPYTYPTANDWLLN